MTENNALISCNYREIKGKLTFENFVIENLNKVTSDEYVDTLVESNVQKFVDAIVHDRYDRAEASFDSVLDSFTMRAKIEESRKKLHKRAERFGEVYNIKETKSYRKFIEALPLLSHFFENNKQELSKNKKLIEGLRLSKVVGETYDLPALALENLQDEFIVVPSNSKKTLYEMVCEKELVRKELLEAKESFHYVWATNDRVSALASHIYSNDKTIKTALKETVQEVPYMALSNKVDLVSLMESVFEVTNPGTISQKDIKEFVDKIYEFKKPLKAQVLEHLNETYGINIQSLRFVPSFKGLAEIQSEIFSMLSESMDDGILCDVLKEFSHTMSKKGGVQVLDVANILTGVMNEANFSVVDIQENFDMKKLSDYISEEINEAQYYGDDDKMSNSGGNCSDDEEDDKKSKKKDKKKEKDEDEKKDEEKDEEKGELRKESVEQEEEVAGEEAETELGEESEEEEAEAAESAQAAEAVKDSEDKEFTDLVADIEKAIKDIDFNLEDDEEESEEEVPEA